METGNVDQLLQDAALKGDVTMLRNLIDQDPLLLYRPSKIRPLHVASRFGRLEFTEEILRLNPSLAEEVDSTDKSSPLHLASGNGHVDLVRALVSTNPCMCLARDAQGRNPAHVAAMKGHVLVLQELIWAVPAAARERVGGGGRGESILHLCVNFNQLEALRAVVATVPAGDAGMLLNAKDGDGNTVLHIAVSDQRVEIIHFLLSDHRVLKNIQNEYGLTAMDIFKKNKDVNPQIDITLKQAKLLSSKEINKEKEEERITSWFHDQRSALMVVASLVATMAFQAGLTPPFMYEKDNPPASLHYQEFVVANTIGLVSSTTSIILLISGLPGRRYFMVVIMVMMWIAISCMTYTYGLSLQASTYAFSYKANQNSTINNSTSLSPGYTPISGPNYDGVNDVLSEYYTIFGTAYVVWACVMALILLGHLITWIGHLGKKIRHCCSTD